PSSRTILTILFRASAVSVPRTLTGQRSTSSEDLIPRHSVANAVAPFQFSPDGMHIATRGLAIDRPVNQQDAIDPRRWLRLNNHVRTGNHRKKHARHIIAVR